MGNLTGQQYPPSACPNLDLTQHFGRLNVSLILEYHLWVPGGIAEPENEGRQGWRDGPSMERGTQPISVKVCYRFVGLFNVTLFFIFLMSKECSSRT